MKSKHVLVDRIRTLIESFESTKCCGIILSQSRPSPLSSTSNPRTSQVPRFWQSELPSIRSGRPNAAELYLLPSIDLCPHFSSNMADLENFTNLFCQSIPADSSILIQHIHHCTRPTCFGLLISNAFSSSATILASSQSRLNELPPPTGLSQSYSLDTLRLLSTLGCRSRLYLSVAPSTISSW